MTLVATPPAFIPALISINGTAPAFRSLLMDASGEKVALIFRAPKTGTLDHFEFRTGTVTQATNGLLCSFQDVDAATGLPDGTADQSATVASGSLGSNAWINPGAFSAGRSVTQGDLVAAVIEWASFAASNSLNINMLDSGQTSGRISNTINNYVLHNTGSWGTAAVTPGIAIAYNDGTYGCIPDNWPTSTLNTHAFDSSTTPDEIGLIFQMPVPCAVAGAAVLIERVSGRDVTVRLYDSDGTTALASVAVDMDVGANNGGWAFVQFTSAISLLANTNYRLTVRPDTAVTNRIYSIGVGNTDAVLDSVPGGQSWHRTRRTDAGSWTQTTGDRP